MIILKETIIIMIAMAMIRNYSGWFWFKMIISNTWCRRGGCCWPCWPQERGGGVMLREYFCRIFSQFKSLASSQLYFLAENLIGGGAAGGAPVPQLGLPHPGAGPGPEWDWYWPWMPWNSHLLLIIFIYHPQILIILKILIILFVMLTCLGGCMYWDWWGPGDCG